MTMNQILIDLPEFQLRIDFNSFVIAGPNTVTLSNIKLLAGAISTTAGTPASYATNCLVKNRFN